MPTSPTSASKTFRKKRAATVKEPKTLHGHARLTVSPAPRGPPKPPTPVLGTSPAGRPGGGRGQHCTSVCHRLRRLASFRRAVFASSRAPCTKTENLWGSSHCESLRYSPETLGKGKPRLSRRRLRARLYGRKSPAWPSKSFFEGTRVHLCNLTTSSTRTTATDCPCLGGRGHGSPGLCGRRQAAPAGSPHRELWTGSRRRAPVLCAYRRRGRSAGVF